MFCTLEVRSQESFIRKYTYKVYMELSLDIIIQYSLVNQHKHDKECHGEHLDVAMAPEKPGRHQPYFQSRAHRFCPWATDPRWATATRHSRVGTRTQHPEVITRQRRIINLFHTLHYHTMKRLEIYTLPTFCPFCLKYFSLWNNALYLVLCNVILLRHSLKYLLWHDTECFLGLMDNMIRCLGPLLLTWINFNPSMDK